MQKCCFLAPAYKPKPVTSSRVLTAWTWYGCCWPPLCRCLVSVRHYHSTGLTLSPITDNALVRGHAVAVLPRPRLPEDWPSPGRRPAEPPHWPAGLASHWSSCSVMKRWLSVTARHRCLRPLLSVTRLVSACQRTRQQPSEVVRWCSNIRSLLLTNRQRDNNFKCCYLNCSLEYYFKATMLSMFLLSSLSTSHGPSGRCVNFKQRVKYRWLAQWGLVLGHLNSHSETLATKPRRQ